MAAPDHNVVEKYNNAKRLQSRKVANTALEEDFIDQENAGDKLVQFNEQTREIQRAHQRTSFHARSSQREASNASVTPNVPDDLSNRPFENRTSSPSAISAVGKLEIKGNARETQHDYLSKKEPRSPSYPFPNARKRTSDSNPNRLADPDTEPRTIQQSRARVMNLQGAEEYWRGPAKPPEHSSLFDPERGSPLTSSPTATRVYDPRTHIFRSKKAYESKPGVLPAPDSLHTRPYSTAGHKRVSSSFEFDTERYLDHQPPGGFLPYDSFNERDPSLLLQPETRPISQEQLVNEVKGIYAGLVMVEKKCAEIDNQQTQNQTEDCQIKLSHEQWQALITSHRTLLHERSDSSLASQHPSASSALRRLAAKSGVTNLLRSLKIRDHNHAQRNGTGRTTKNITNNRELPKTKHVLSGLIGEIPVCALPDTGAQANFISARLVRKLGYVADFNVESQDNFSLVNGSSLKSYGKIQLPWKFAKEPETYSLTFRVVDNQLDEIVLGSSFLIETETLTGNPHRLSKQPDRDRNRYGLCNIGSPTQHVPGFLDEIHVSAFADTGCQLNIMSENYAAALNYDIIGAEDERVVFELPNGSIVPSPGYVEARFAFEDDPTKETLMYFDILPDSNYDIILGSDMLFENDVFMENSNRIVPGIPLSELPELLLVGFFIERRRKHQLERLQGEEREDAAGEDHRRFWAQKDIEECQEATARQALEGEDIKLHEEWQERSARRRQQMQVLANSPRVALPTSGSRTSQAGPKPRRRLLFWGRT